MPQFRFEHLGIMIDVDPDIEAHHCTPTGCTPTLIDSGAGAASEKLDHAIDMLERALEKLKEERDKA